MPLSPFSFVTSPDIRFGRNEARRSVPEIAALGARILVVAGSSTARVEWLLDALEAEGRAVSTFCVAGEPSVETITSGVALARQSDAQVVVAIGGGAVVDAGKAISALVPATRDMIDHLEVVGLGLPLDHPPLPFVAIPTTAGTGAEVTRNAVISVPEHRRKVSLRDPAMMPRLAIIDPVLTDSCSRSVTLASGLDAITQAIEPYICTRANPMTDALCRSAIPHGLAALQTLMKGQNADARDEMAWVSLCGGLALANAGLGVVHGLAGPLGGLSGAAHGAICGALLPHGLAMNAARVTDGRLSNRIEEVRQWIAEAFQCDVGEAFNTLARWSSDMGLLGLAAQGVTPEHCTAASISAATSSSMKANPVALSSDDLLQVMEAAR